MRIPVSIHRRVKQKRDKHLELKFYDGNQGDGKIMKGIGGGFLCIH